MESIEKNGKSVEEAIEAALAALHATRDQVQVEVLEDGSKGLAGSGQARVRVTLLSTGADPAGMADASPSDRVEAGDSSESPASDSEGAESSAPQESQGAWAANEQGEGADSEALAEEEEFAERAREVTQRILDLMPLELTAHVANVDRQQVELELEGPDSRIIIGKHGQTLDALQHLVSIIANKETRRRRRVLIDAEGYQQRRRARREEELVEMARADAQRAKELGQEAVIQYAVGPYERRLIHMAFVDDPEFTTYSEGVEPHRYVVVSPRD